LAGPRSPVDEIPKACGAHAGSGSIRNWVVDDRLPLPGTHGKKIGARLLPRIVTNHVCVLSVGGHVGDASGVDQTASSPVAEGGDAGRDVLLA
jgi:hypothetical protein